MQIHKVPFDNHLNLINQIKRECLCDLKVWKYQKEASIEFALFEKTSDLKKSKNPILKINAEQNLKSRKAKKLGPNTYDDWSSECSM